MPASIFTGTARRAAELGLLALALTGLAAVFVQLPVGNAQEPVAAAFTPPVAPCDPAVELAAAFPKFRFIQSSNYNLVTDASPATAHRTLELLTTLRQQFLHHFATLIQSGTEPDRIEVVYFSHEADYRASVLLIAPGLVNSAGLFSPQANRLLLLDQFGSADYVHAQLALTAQQRRLATLANVHQDERLQASVRLAEMRTTVASEAQLFTTRLTRHEGAHQLFHAYGIESAYPVAPTWLTEGLAQYCEAEEIGTLDKLLVNRLKTARNLLPLRQLLNHREPAGFFSLGQDLIPTAYAQSWALTYFLMHQPGFLNFIQHYRDVTDAGAAQRTRSEDTATTLAQFLGTDFPTLEKRWQEFLNQL